MSLPQKFSIAMPVEVVASGGILVRQVDTNGAALDDSTTIYSVAIPVMPVTISGVNEDSSLTFSEHRLITISPNGIPVVRVGADGTSSSTSLSTPTELITNGGFDVDANWTKALGATISGGTANCASATAFTAFLSQNGVNIVIGGTYRLTYTISGLTGGGVVPNCQFAGQGATSWTQRTANGTYTEDKTATGNQTTFQFSTGSTGFTGSIDNVSLTRIS